MFKSMQLMRKISTHLREMRILMAQRKKLNAKKKFSQHKYYFLNFSCMFLNPNIFFPIWILIVLIYHYLRKLQEQVKKAFCYQKLLWPFTVQIYFFKLFLHVSKSQYFFSDLNSNCSNPLDLKNLQEKVKKAFCFQKLFWLKKVSDFSLLW